MGENIPPLMGAGGLVLLDGVAVRRVTAFDTDQGWVEALCTGQKPGHPDRPHRDTDDRDSICRIRLTGSVEYVP